MCVCVCAHLCACVSVSVLHQVSGLRFSFDPHATVGTRVTPSDVWLGNMPLDLQASYSLACTSYVLQGKVGASTCHSRASCLVDRTFGLTACALYTMWQSGFTMLKQSPEVLDDIDTHGPLLKDIVQHRLKSSTIVCLAARGPLGCAILYTQPIMLTVGHPTTVSHFHNALVQHSGPRIRIKSNCETASQAAPLAVAATHEPSTAAHLRGVSRPPSSVVSSCS